MTTPDSPAAVGQTALQRVRVFVDFWNFQLALNEAEAKKEGVKVEEVRFKVDWRGLGPWLARKAAELVGLNAGSYSFDGVIIYASYNPQTTEGPKFHHWATTWLDRQPGVKVEIRERRRKALPRCPSCHKEIRFCPHDGCKKAIIATEEKGVDTLIATDMIRLAWEGAYDLAVLATSDSDLVPAVQFLGLRARKVIQAGFPPLGVALATACWASFDVADQLGEIRRTEPPPKPEKPAKRSN